MTLYSAWSTARDHPRVCGEHEDGDKLEEREVGSSPRMRGAPSASKTS